MIDILNTLLEKETWGHLISLEVREITVDHAQRVLEVNQIMNLTSIVEPTEVVIKHIIDSLSLIPILEFWDTPHPKKFLDIGSGGGWPFVPLAAYFRDVESWACEKTIKKANFIKRICSDLLPQAQVFSYQVSELREPKFDLITSRAVGKLHELCADSIHLLNPGGFFVGFKGPSWVQEKKSWQKCLEKYSLEELPSQEIRLPDGSKRIFVGARF